MLEREPALRPTVIPRLEAPLLAERVRLLLEDPDLAAQVAEAGRRYAGEHHDAAAWPTATTTSCAAAATWRRPPARAA